MSARLTTLIDGAIADRVFPGATVLAARAGELCLAVTRGRFDYHPGSTSLAPEHMFDLASLTKPLATTTLVARALERHALDLDAPVRRWLPELRGPGAELSARDLLGHRGGYPACVELAPRDRPPPLDAASVAARRGALLELAPRSAQPDTTAEPGDWAPPGARVRYSDVGFLVLGLLLERLDGAPLDAGFTAAAAALAGERCQAGFGPKPTALCPPSERRPWGDPRQGQVHDENAEALGGVAGHAGLFGRAADVLALALAWAGRGEGPEALDRRTRSVFSTRQAHPCGSTRALGWDTNAEPARGGVPGPRFGPEWFGHTGYTGGALWLREGGDVLLCLCHRTWPRRPSQELGSRAIQAFRKDLYEELARCLPALTRP